MNFTRLCITIHSTTAGVFFLFVSLRSVLVAAQKVEGRYAMIPIPGRAVLESIECLWSLFVFRVIYVMEE